MYWPTESKSVPLTDIGWSNVIYLADGSPLRDSYMVWGTTVELDLMDDFLAVQSRHSNRMISLVHVLIKAVSRALMDHPRLNRRVIGRRVHQYDGVSIVVPIRRPSDGVVDVVFFQDTRPLTLADVADRMWNEARDRALKIAQERRCQSEGTPYQKCVQQWLQWLRLQVCMKLVNTCLMLTNRLRLPTWSPWNKELNGANAFVNFLGFNGAPPMISYKPSSLGTNSFSVSVTMGSIEQRPVVRGGQVVICKTAPVFVRADHRLINGHQMGEFIATLRTYLTNPEALVESIARSGSETPTIAA